MSHPSRPTVIAVNLTASDVFISDMGWTVPGSGQSNLHTYFYPHEIHGSRDLYVAVDDGYLAINDGVTTFSEVQSLNFLKSVFNHNDLQANAVFHTSSSAAGQIPKFNGTDGREVIASGITIDNSNNVNLGGSVITNSGAPVGGTDLVNKNYVDNLINGVDTKEAVRAATTGSIVLFDSQTVDGVPLVAGDRVLVKDQSPASENGIYVVVEDGYWTRATDLPNGDSAASVYMFVSEGSANADKGFVCTNDVGSDVVGTNNLAFVVFTTFSLATLAPNDVNVGTAQVGTSSRAAREDHKHDIDTAAAGAIQIGDVAAEGTSASLARADHVHSVASAAPVAVGTANVEGVAVTFSRSDHVHDVPFSAVQNALSEADGYISVNGQVISNVAYPVLGGDAANKDYVDGYVASMLSSTLTNVAPVDVDAGFAAVGVSVYAARADHKHDVSTAAPTVGIGAGNLEGVSNSLARADHNHALRESGGAELTLGAIADGQVVYRDGYTLKGGMIIFPPSATNPVAPAPSDGDRYYNTTMDMWMYYDAGRGKWLSDETIIFDFGRAGNTAQGTYYRGTDSRVLSSTSGWYAGFNGTVVGLGYTRSDSDAATFDVVANGSSIATVASSALLGGSVSLNGDFAQGDVLACRNQAGGNDTSNVVAYVRIKWRA